MVVEGVDAEGEIHQPLTPQMTAVQSCEADGQPGLVEVKIELENDH